MDAWGWCALFKMALSYGPERVNKGTEAYGVDLKKIGPTLLLNECILHMNSGYSGHLGTLSHPWRHSTDQPSSKIHHPSPQGKSTKVNTPYSKLGQGILEYRLHVVFTFPS